MSREVCGFANGEDGDHKDRSDCYSKEVAHPTPVLVLYQVCVDERAEEKPTGQGKMEDHEVVAAFVGSHHVADHGRDSGIGCGCGEPGEDA